MATISFERKISLTSKDMDVANKAPPLHFTMIAFKL